MQGKDIKSKSIISIGGNPSHLEKALTPTSQKPSIFTPHDLPPPPEKGTGGHGITLSTGWWYYTRF